MKLPLRILIPAVLALLMLALPVAGTLAQTNGEDRREPPNVNEPEEQSEGEAQTGSQQEAAPSSDEDSQRLPPDPGFTPTERLRWDQEVDYPTNI